MNLEKFQQSLNSINLKLIDDVKNGLKLTDISNGYIENYEALINEGFNSKDKKQIVNHIAFNLCMFTFAELALINRTDALNNNAIPLINSQENFNASLKAANSTLSIMIEKNTQARQKGAVTKLANDIKQKEKIIVKECWDDWQGNPMQYTYNSEFANAMIDKFRPDDPEEQRKHLCSVKQITKWCTEWKKEAC